MKEKKKVYIVVTKYKSEENAIEEERLYLIEGKTYKEYINGSFKKSFNVKEGMKLFVLEAHVAAVYLSQKELTVVMSKQGYFYFKEDFKQKEVYNLREEKRKSEFFEEFF